ncbi:hypothetical protein NKR23_g3681 [Pleurostoma richardsiae]|uniref:Uncharacterized protein n=1 Tax=Pleurostoma richardsiae TaxID=41990 RepID=A0AA38RKK9_9PEZI|nr:hypothetical protein NKR23_g3681 [Pleurostoma richardsiae]
MGSDSGRPAKKRRTTADGEAAPGTSTQAIQNPTAPAAANTADLDTPQQPAHDTATATVPTTDLDTPQQPTGGTTTAAPGNPAPPRNIMLYVPVKGDFHFKGFDVSLLPKMNSPQGHLLINTCYFPLGFYHYRPTRAAIRTIQVVAIHLRQHVSLDAAQRLKSMKDQIILETMTKALESGHTFTRYEASKRHLWNVVQAARSLPVTTANAELDCVGFLSCLMSLEDMSQESEDMITSDRIQLQVLNPPQDLHPGVPRDPVLARAILRTLCHSTARYMEMSHTHELAIVKTVKAFVDAHVAAELLRLMTI